MIEHPEKLINLNIILKIIETAFTASIPLETSVVNLFPFIDFNARL